MSIYGIDVFMAEMSEHVSLTPWYTRKIRQAYRLAKELHRGQLRDGGERYFNHPREVARQYVQFCTILGFPVEANGIIAALLHDVVEDCVDIEIEDIVSFFNFTVAGYVDALTNRDGESKEDLHDRIANAPFTAKLIKIADRVHNVSTLNECRPAKRRKKILETEEIFVEIAYELGPKIGTILVDHMNQVKM